jgi:hypothetical protein
MKAKDPRQQTQQQMQSSRHKTFGPKMPEIIVNGFNEKVIRPKGGGKYGFTLGSSRALPTGRAMVSDSGTIEIEIASLPLNMKSKSSERVRVSESE